MGQRSGHERDGRGEDQGDGRQLLEWLDKVEEELGEKSEAVMFVGC